jgi:hypothetical protein
MESLCLLAEIIVIVLICWMGWRDDGRPRELHTSWFRAAVDPVAKSKTMEPTWRRKAGNHK